MRKGTQPLLFFSAAQLFVACGASSCNQERVQSAAGIYCYCKLRASLQPARVEMLTLARHWLRKNAADLARGRTLEDVELQELRELEAERASEAVSD
jgi:hypothetical protein